MVAVGHVVDLNAKKIHMARKGRLAAERIALSNRRDLGMWMRMVSVEMRAGLFLRMIIGARNGYAVISPFLYPPGAKKPRRN